MQMLISLAFKYRLMVSMRPIARAPLWKFCRFGSCHASTYTYVSLPGLRCTIRLRKSQPSNAICSFIEEANDLGVQIELAVLDAPERSTCRKMKQHGGYYSCETCYVNPINYKTPGRSGCKCKFRHLKVLR